MVIKGNTRSLDHSSHEGSSLGVYIASFMYALGFRV